MRAYEALPKGYEEIFSVDLQKNKKIALLINIIAAAIMIAMAIPMHFYISIGTLFDFSEGFGVYLLKFGVLFAGIVAYIILHELVHGIVMKIFGAKKIKYGFTGLYAFAGCDDYFDKASYICVALAPIAVWGTVLSIICAVVSPMWFWVVYFIQIMNISGAAGDMYVTCKFSGMPKDILVHDSGVGMTVYSKK